MNFEGNRKSFGRWTWPVSGLHALLSPLVPGIYPPDLVSPFHHLEYLRPLLMSTAESDPGLILFRVLLISIESVLDFFTYKTLATFPSPRLELRSEHDPCRPHCLGNRKISARTSPPTLCNPVFLLRHFACLRNVSVLSFSLHCCETES